MPQWDFDNWALGFDAAWELDFWGLFRRAIESAGANVDARIANYDDVLVILQGEVAATYIEARTLEKRLQYAHRNIQLQKNTARISTDRFEQGMVSKLDVHQANSNLAVTESMVPLLEAAHRHARNRLCTLLAMPPRDLDARLGNTGRIPMARPGVAVGIPAGLLRAAVPTSAAPSARLPRSVPRSAWPRANSTRISQSPVPSPWRRKCLRTCSSRRAWRERSGRASSGTF